jgi:hypothetical protein
MEIIKYAWLEIKRRKRLTLSFAGSSLPGTSKMLKYI